MDRRSFLRSTFAGLAALTVDRLCAAPRVVEQTPGGVYFASSFIEPSEVILDLAFGPAVVQRVEVKAFKEGAMVSLTCLCWLRFKPGDLNCSCFHVPPNVMHTYDVEGAVIIPPKGSLCLVAKAFEPGTEIIGRLVTYPVPASMFTDEYQSLRV